jgi:CHAD domain-containing protein
VRAIHQARVASRRLREALPIAAAAARTGEWSGLRRDIRRVTRALGDVREMDVALLEFDDDVHGRTWNAIAVQRVREYLQSERARREQSMRAKLQTIKPPRVLERCKAIAAALEKRPPDVWRAILAGRLRKRARRFKSALHAVGTMYAAEPLHTVRIAGKKLRYSLELAHGAGDTAVGRQIGVLRRLQDLLGRLRDLQTLQSYVHIVAAESSDVSLTRALDAISSDIEAECRVRHAEFLRQADRLSALADRVAQHVAVQLMPGVRRMAKAPAPGVRRLARAASA